MHGDKGSGYRGCQTKTKSGRTCQKWTVQAPHTHAYARTNRAGQGLGDHNYCRNPGGSDASIWCFTTDKGKEREYCDPMQAHQKQPKQKEEPGWSTRALTAHARPTREIIDSSIDPCT